MYQSFNERIRGLLVFDRLVASQGLASVPRNSLIYHEKLLDFAMDCSDLQSVVTLA
jgi:hypothetical protein